MITAFGMHVVKLDAGTGAELWRVALQGTQGAAIRIQVLGEFGDELLALATEELRILRLSDGSTVRRVALTTGHDNMLVVGRRVLLSARGEISCVDLDRGTVLWRNELPGTGFGPAAIAVPGAGTVQGDLGG